MFVLVGRPPPFADEGAVGAGGADRPDDVGGLSFGESFAERSFAGQGARDPALVFVARLPLLLVDGGDLGVSASGPSHDLVDRGAAVADASRDLGEQSELPVWVGLAFHCPPVLAVWQRPCVIVSGDAGVDQFGEDCAFVAEHRVQGLDGDVGMLGDRGHRRRGVAVAREKVLGSVEDASSGLERLSRSPAGGGLTGVSIHD